MYAGYATQVRIGTQRAFGTADSLTAEINQSWSHSVIVFTWSCVNTKINKKYTEKYLTYTFRGYETDF